MLEIYPAIEQKDFSGGYNVQDKSASLKPNEVAAGSSNFFLERYARSRKGRLKHNTVAITGGPVIDTLFQFKKANFLENHLMIAGSDKTLYKYTGANMPTTPMASQPDKIWATADSGHKPPQFANFNDILVSTNGVDRPQVYLGDAQFAQAIVKKDSSGFFTDYASTMIDDDDNTKIDLDSFGTSDKLYIGYMFRFNRLIVDVENENENASVLTAKYHDGTTTAGEPDFVDLDETDGTVSGGKTFKIDGDIAFNDTWWGTGSGLRDLMKSTKINGITLYWIELTVSAALSSNVKLNSIKVSLRDDLSETVNGVSGVLTQTQNLHPLWNGERLRVSGAYKYVDATEQFEDNFAVVRDGIEASFLEADLLTTSDFIYLATSRQAGAIKLYITKDVNDQAVTMTVEVYDGTAWRSVMDTDGTLVDSKTLGQTGIVTLGGTATKNGYIEGAALYSIEGEPRKYWYRLSFSGALGAQSEIYNVEFIPLMGRVSPYRHCIVWKNRLLFANSPEEPNRILFTGRGNMSNCSGKSPDSGFIYLDGREAITGWALFYNELIVFKANKIFILEGYSPLTFNWMMITDDAGTVASQSIMEIPWNSISVTGVEDNRMVIAFTYKDGLYTFDGRGVQKLSNNIQPHWNDIDKAYAERIVLGRMRDRNCVMVSIPDSSVSGYDSENPANNRIQVFNYVHKTWNAPFDYGVASFMEFETSNAGSFLPYSGDTAGFIRREDVGQTDDGDDIAKTLVTRDFLELSAAFTMQYLTTLIAAQSGGEITISGASDGNDNYFEIANPFQIKPGYRYLLEKVKLREQVNMFSVKYEADGAVEIAICALALIIEPRTDQGDQAIKG